VAAVAASWKDLRFSLEAGEAIGIVRDGIRQTFSATSRFSVVAQARIRPQVQKTVPRLYSIPSRHSHHRV
jgi:hypothetical protein